MGFFFTIWAYILIIGINSRKKIFFEKISYVNLLARPLRQVAGEYLDCWVPLILILGSKWICPKIWGWLVLIFFINMKRRGSHDQPLIIRGWSCNCQHDPLPHKTLKFCDSKRILCVVGVLQQDLDPGGLNKTFFAA